MAPLVSVLLPVYNGAPYLHAALESVFSQTFDDFEVIAINDGSGDSSGDILRSVSDPRFRYFEQANQGLAATLNRAIHEARGIYLARQDQDDLSRPDRFAKQVAYLDEHPEYGLLGTWAEIWLENVPGARAHRHPTENHEIQFDLLFDNPFVHSSVMFRRSLVETIGGYSTDRSRQPPEDYELWSRMARHCRAANLPELLLVYREMPSSMSRDGVNPFLDRVIAISVENLAWATGRSLPDEALQDTTALLQRAFHRVSGAPDLAGLQQVIRDAGAGVARHCQVPLERLEAKIATTIGNLEHHYRSRSGVEGWMRRSLACVRKVFR